MAARILVVDDDDATRAGMVEFLQHAGYEAAAVGSFDEARKELRAKTPDLLITDIRLREYNGLQLLIWMPTPIRAIVVTGFPDPVLEAEARTQGAPVLVKPITPSVLLKAVEDALTQAPGATKRRWVRKRMTTPLAADVNGAAARILDISYGGVRVELEREPERDIVHPFTMAVGDVVLPVDLVWDRPEGDHAWTCGLAVVRLNQQTSNTWFGFVDRVA
jgi:DNA-binding response OmpR family regulator